MRSFNWIQALLVSLFITHCKGQVNGLDTSKIIAAFVDGAAGSMFFQDYLDKNTVYKATADNDPISVRDQVVVEPLLKELTAYFNVIQSLASFVTKNVDVKSTSPTAYIECCTNRLEIGVNVVFDAYHQTLMDLNNFCYFKPTPNTVPIPIPDGSADGLLKTFKDNLAMIHAIDAQYLGTEAGVLYHYPSIQDNNCYAYDPRLRPWYGQTYNRYPRDVVISIDLSAKMKSGRMTDGVRFSDAALQAVQYILDTLGSKDRVAVVLLGAPRLPSSSVLNTCFLSELAPASERVKADIKQYLNSLEPDGQSMYAQAINTAMKIIQDKLDHNRSAVVTLISGVRPSDTLDDRKAVITKASLYPWNRRPPSLLGYVLGTSKDLQIDVQAMLVQYTFSQQTMIISQSNGLANVALYYKNLEKSDQTPRMSAPYIDPSTTEYIVTFSQAVIDKNGVLLGVVGIDVNMAALLRPLMTFQAGLNSYVFLFDRDDNSTLFHPLIPTPGDQGLQPSVLDISILEHGTQSGIVGQMARGQNGSLEGIQTTRYISKADPYQQGVTAVQGKTSYYYSPIDVDSVSWEVCVVLGTDHNLLTRSLLSNLAAKFVYHRLDLKVQTSDPTLDCRLFSRQSLTANSVVKFAPRSFINPASYLYTDETPAFVTNLVNIVVQNGPNDLLLQGAVEDVALTSTLDDLWSTGALSYNTVTFVIWRYIGTQRGMLRIHPPILNSKIYDPTARPWYKAAVSQKGLRVLTPPYLDVGGAGFICTAAHAIYENGVNVFGVVAVDMSINHVYLRIEIVYMQDCTVDGFSCFLMDTAGYIITHSLWYITGYTGNIKVQGAHITDIEPDIANHMIMNGYLTRKSCSNLFDYKNETFYEVSIRRDLDKLSDPLAGYKISQAPGTNVYVILKKSNTLGHSDVFKCACGTPTSQTTSPSQTTSSQTQPLCVQQDNQCECPCYKLAPFSPCTQKFDTSSWIMCPPVPRDPFGVKENILLDPKMLVVKGLEFCGAKQCVLQTSEFSCHYIYHCRWCTHSHSGQVLATPYCADYDQCWFGQVLRPSPYPVHQPKALNPLIIGLIGSAVAVVVLMGTAIAFWQVKVHRAKGKAQQQKKKKRQFEPLPDLPPILLKQQHTTAEPIIRTVTVESNVTVERNISHTESKRNKPTTTDNIPKTVAAPGEEHEQAL